MLYLYRINAYRINRILSKLVNLKYYRLVVNGTQEGAFA